MASLDPFSSSHEKSRSMSQAGQWVRLLAWACESRVSCHQTRNKKNNSVLGTSEMGIMKEKTSDDGATC
jgi:hypothetical protein